MFFAQPKDLDPVTVVGIVVLGIGILAVGLAVAVNVGIGTIGDAVAVNVGIGAIGNAITIDIRIIDIADAVAIKIFFFKTGFGAAFAAAGDRRAQQMTKTENRRYKGMAGAVGKVKSVGKSTTMVS